MAKPDQRRLAAVAWLFLKLGTTGFGGPAAHIAMFEDEVVRRRGWLTREEFLDLLGATNLIPGPNSTEMAMHIGQRHAGWPGLLVAGACFILPATLIAATVAWSYVRYGTLPQAEAILYGIKPVIIAVVVQALWSLGRRALKTRLLSAVAAGAVLANALGLNELAVLLGAGILMATIQSVRAWKRPRAQLLLAPTFFNSSLLATAVAGSAGAAAAPFGVWPLFLFFLKVGAVLYGSGYVLLAFLRADLVERLGWLTESQLLDAIAVGQMMPGPLFTTATFVGYVLGGLPAAALATFGIFLPAFFFVAISGPVIPRLRRSPLAGTVLDGVNAASLALMAVVTFHLGTAALVDGLTWMLAGVAAFALFCFRLNSAWLVGGGAVVGLVKAWLS